ncbi:MAG: C39 family peptidase [Anaerolineales bacterium]|nr:C39 family peptidase [Anaerolineales bacterium]
MSSQQAQDEIRTRRMKQPSRKEYGFLSLGAILSVNAVIMGSFLALLFLPNHLSPPYHTMEPTPEASSTPTLTPTPTATPFQASPLTSTPTASLTPSPTPTSTPTATHTPKPPPSSRITGISGYPQSMPLSCESRSAVDWARYFGKSINEYTFFNGLPKSDNPDEGFVGSVYGRWGQIPPAPYGVHAKPIAQRLRSFGLNAKAVRGMTLEELKAEIAAGRPVIVWVIGHLANGTSIPYTSSSGHKTTVARYEHTVIVVGYEKNKIYVLDGAKRYFSYENGFMSSWNVLGNMAVVWIE